MSKDNIRENMDFYAVSKKMLVKEMPKYFANAQRAWRESFPQQADAIIEVVQALYNPQHSWKPKDGNPEDLEVMTQTVSWRRLPRFATRSLVLDTTFVNSLAPGGSVESLGWDLMNRFRREIGSRLPDTQIQQVLENLQATLYIPLNDSFTASFNEGVREYIPPGHDSHVNHASKVVQRNVFKLVFYAIIAELLDDPSLKLQPLLDQYLQGIYLIGFDNRDGAAYILRNF